MTVIRLRCKRKSCLHIWTPRTANPKWCPKCHYGKFDVRTKDTLKVDVILHGSPVPETKRQYENLKHSKMAKAPEEIAAYCFRCQSNKLMEQVGHVKLKNGKNAVRGICSSCGTRMYKIERVNRNVDVLPRANSSTP